LLKTCSLSKYNVGATHVKRTSYFYVFSETGIVDLPHEVVYFVERFIIWVDIAFKIFWTIGRKLSVVEIVR